MLVTLSLNVSVNLEEVNALVILHEPGMTTDSTTIKEHWQLWVEYDHRCRIHVYSFEAEVDAIDEKTRMEYLINNALGIYKDVDEMSRDSEDIDMKPDPKKGRPMFPKGSWSWSH